MLLFFLYIPFMRYFPVFAAKMNTESQKYLTEIFNLNKNNSFIWFHLCFLSKLLKHFNWLRKYDINNNKYQVLVLRTGRFREHFSVAVFHGRQSRKCEHYSDSHCGIIVVSIQRNWERYLATAAQSSAFPAACSVA